ncbi:leucyl/phenylalanyl-tRNA--protein transferase [Paucidesulfovibrio gracilis DSM 16080]|uniref:Leucyl/phenylalanyl-tRNA--protein transferase n=1 Tax=Paucidesulfovibrio gracilis DSM 16080 TaxID=1121449 RepID=A0A1T4WSP5_9BACT|nr:leucyl/phenylalanyl-tRNA--protein transferase [Paucidesulfovibrio gracilis]SKA80299.1 leucyl/phenylalanyl-tRNA--protein transferase [Paucidesulfovibrio gracilis DSM 16080]
MIYRLSEMPFFPHPQEADPDGLLAVGGDLSSQRLLNAYSCGIFPWYAPDSPILWWSTDPRLVLFPSELHVPRSLRRVINSGRFHITVDTAFPEVLRRCAETPRPDQDGSWIVPEMKDAYTRLHELGYAHSVEAWRDGRLVGGLYGVALGRVFFGESMFYAEPDASKVAFVQLVRSLERREYTMVDCQQTTAHLLRFGAREVRRSEFLQRLALAQQYATEEGNWSELFHEKGNGVFHQL